MYVVCIFLYLQFDFHPNMKQVFFISKQRSIGVIPLEQKKKHDLIIEQAPSKFKAWHVTFQKGGEEKWESNI